MTVPRSKSNDINKKEPIDKKSNGQFHFNSFKQWGKNRLRQMTLRSHDEKLASLPMDKDVSDIDDFNINETLRTGVVKRRQDRRFSYERKPFYSSSDCNTPSLNSNIFNSVKIRETSNSRRQRRNGPSKDEPNSSSGNWSASSESGRTSIGSEITTTTQPKSSTSSGSLNHPPLASLSSGPPSSIISRRRFLNTSASSSITSEGTTTPDLQTDFHDEDGSSSVYSCDTEGYYTSFHVDSGLKTLKEEESATPNRHSSTTSFESSGNQTVISPENEYELFGRGSTSTTTSSAGTVCTAVLTDQDRNVCMIPERNNSPTKLHRCGSSVSECNLQRSCSSSTVESALEGAATIKRNGVLLQKGVAALMYQAKNESKGSHAESVESENTNEGSSHFTKLAPENKNNLEVECSEYSDLECADHLKRMKYKTSINSSRIPSMCVITPANSDDEDMNKKSNCNLAGSDSFKSTPVQSRNETSLPLKDVQHFKRTTLLPLNTFIGRLKEVLPSLKKSPPKDAPLAETEEYYDTGDYVTITEKNQYDKVHPSGVYFSNDVVKRNLATVLSGNLEDAEYVSLNELPCNTRYNEDKDVNKSSKLIVHDERGDVQQNMRVVPNAHGKVIYNSDSLKRRKAHTTFIPGPFVKDSTNLTLSVTQAASTTLDIENVKSNRINTSSETSINDTIMPENLINCQDKSKPVHLGRYFHMFLLK